MIRFLLLAGSGLLVQMALGGAGPAHPAHLLWAAPAIVAAAFLVSWGAEAAQFLVSQGLALAILAWLQTMPEFAVEADIAWNAARHTPRYDDSLVTANFTGSIRLLMGFGMPVVFFIHAWTKKGPRWDPIELDPFHSVEIVSALPPVAYFFFIVYRGQLDLMDSIILLGYYGAYMMLLLKLPPEEVGESVEDLPLLTRRILRQGTAGRALGIALIFGVGAVVLYAAVHPFVDGLQSLAGLVGISGYFFIQWVAPFVSEFPEKVTAFNWARQPGKAKMGLMNFLSSNINQMTTLVAMIPIVYAWSAGGLKPILLSSSQKSEVLLTAAQATLSMVLLFNMKFEWTEAVGLFLLFVLQFASPGWAPWFGLTGEQVRHAAVGVYLGWALLEVVLALFGVRRWSFPLRLGRRTRRILRAR